MMIKPRQHLMPFLIITCCVIALYIPKVFYVFDVIAERYTIYIGNLLKQKTINDKIAVIAIKKEPFGWKGRGKNADIVKKLSAAGARVIVFDMGFEAMPEKEADPELIKPELIKFDEQLTKAIRQARKRGTAVLAGIRNYTKHGPVIAENYKQTFSGFGIPYIERREKDNPRAIVLAIIRKGISETIWGLSLKAVEAYESGNLSFIDTAAQEIWLEPDRKSDPLSCKFSYMTYYDNVPKDHSILTNGDRIFLLHIDLSPIRKLTYAERDDVINASPEDMKKYNSRIVIIGHYTEDDRYTIYEGLTPTARQYYGVEILALGINTILNNICIRPVTPLSEIIFIFIFGYMGYITGAKIRKPESWKTVLTATTAFIIIFAVQIFLYRFSYILMNLLSYNFLSFMLNFVITKNNSKGEKNENHQKHAVPEPIPDSVNTDVA